MSKDLKKKRKNIIFQMIKNTQLNPPIAYKTPNGYSLVLEPLARYCKNVDRNVISKFSMVKFENHVYINVDDNLTDLLRTGDVNSTIVYKLKVIYIYIYMTISYYIDPRK